MAELKSYDVSENNDLGQEHFNAMADAGCTTVTIRSSYGRTNEDSKFREYYGYAKNAGLAVNVYHYGYAHNPDESRVEAQMCKQVLESSGAEVGVVFYDIEEDRFRGQATECAQAFIEELGLNCGIYASLSWMENEIDWQSLGCPIWVAQYLYSYAPNTDSASLKGYAWQFSDREPLLDKTLDCSIIFTAD